jgi:hypothetical protein
LAIYRSIVDREPRTFRHLLLILFDEEIAFRNALWNRTESDDGAFSEGIFHCAFLIHCCGEPGDTAILWTAQYLNQDIGELDGEYFVGAGLTETLSYLSHADGEASNGIARHIKQWSSYGSDNSLASWQQGRRQWLQDDAERMTS